jgi:iron complex outermembrane receptor protein
MSTGNTTLMAAGLPLASAKHAGPAFAREAAKKSGAEIETVLVPGIRASLAKSPAAKREPQTVIDVLASEDAGKFPDENMAESLLSVSGVSISREFGEGERVSQQAATRSFNYLLLPI